MTAAEAHDARDHLFGGWQRERRDAFRLAYWSMTVGEALEILNRPAYGCACPGPLVCCWQSHAIARDLQRAAYTVARLLTDAASKGTATEPGRETASESRGGSAGSGASVGTGGASEAAQGARG